MQRYHIKVDGIPEYINMIEDAQKQAGRSGQTIAEKNLLLFAIPSMLTTERYPQANNYWEDIAQDKIPGLTGRHATKRHTQSRGSKHRQPKGPTNSALLTQPSGTSKYALKITAV